MSDINWGTLSPLDQLASIKTAQPQAQQAPQPQAPSSGSTGLLGGLGDLLGGLSKAFGQNPVSVANKALTDQMQATPGPDLAKAIMGQSSPQSMPQRVNNAVQGNGALATPSMPSMPGTLLPGDALQQSQGLLKKFEGFQSKPTWDVNAYRTGYGSDTITNPDGSIAKVKPGMSVSEQDAERDLARRTKEFQDGAARQVGKPWETLPTNAQASLTSVAYNYGSLPKNVVAAAKTGDLNQIAEAIQAHATDNKGINKDRRMKEAQYALANANPGNAQYKDQLSNLAGHFNTSVPFSEQITDPKLKEAYTQTINTLPADKGANMNLNPALVSKLPAFIEDLRQQGFKPKIIEGFRTPEEQAQKVSEGNSHTMKSNHVVGSAVDIIDERLGQDITPKNRQEIARYSQAMEKTAAKYGLVSGTKWKSFGPYGDFAHIQYNLASNN